MRYKEIEILIENEIRIENMTIDERNNIITFLYNTKTLKDNPSMRIVTCNLKKVKENIYKANGAMSSDDGKVNWFDSYIEININQLSIKSEIAELCQKKEFSEYTVFNTNDNKNYKRYTKYSHNDTQFEDEIVIDDFDIIYGDKPKKNKI